MNPYAIEEVIAFLWRAYKAYGELEKADTLVTTIRENEYISANSWKMTATIFFISIFKFLGAKTPVDNSFSDSELIAHAIRYIELNPRLATPRNGSDFSISFISTSQSYYMSFMAPGLDKAIKMVATNELDRLTKNITTHAVLSASAQIFLNNAKTLGLLASDTYSTSVLHLKFTSVYDKLYSDLLSSSETIEARKKGNKFFGSNYFVLLYNKIMTTTKISFDLSSALPFDEANTAIVTPFVYYPLFAQHFDYGSLPHPLSSHATPLPKPRSLATDIQEGMKEIVKTLQR